MSIKHPSLHNNTADASGNLEDLMSNDSESEEKKVLNMAAEI